MLYWHDNEMVLASKKHLIYFELNAKSCWSWL